jgi:hypothetical protein
MDEEENSSVTISHIKVEDAGGEKKLDGGNQFYFSPWFLRLSLELDFFMALSQQLSRNLLSLLSFNSTAFCSSNPSNSQVSNFQGFQHPAPLSPLQPFN